MKNISPFIKKIKTENGYYIYDVFKNDILTVDNTTYDIIEDFYNLSKTELIAKYNKNYNIEKLENRWKIIEKKITQGYFSNERPNLNTNYSLLEDEEIRCRMFKSLILIATHDCNLRCKYCAYSGKYFYNRTHANRKMSIATAQKAINLLKIPEKYYYLVRFKILYPTVKFNRGSPLFMSDEHLPDDFLLGDVSSG